MPKSLDAIQTCLGSRKLARFILSRKIIRLNTDKTLKENLDDLKGSLGERKYKELERRICAEYTVISKSGNLARWC